MFWCYTRLRPVAPKRLAPPCGQGHGRSQARTRQFDFISPLNISDYMNNKDTDKANIGNTKRKKLPPEAVRSCTVTTKMTAAEREKIHDIAAGCNLTPSDYMRQRALGYEPPSALTAEESALLHNLDGCRVDILNFANALAGMKQDKRIILFQKVSFMLDWYRQVVPITNAVTEFLNSVINAGRLSPRTRKTITKI